MKEIEQLFNHGPVVVFKWRNAENWPVEYVSDNVSEIIGYSRDEILADTFIYSKIIHTEDLKRVGEEVVENSKSSIEYFIHQPYRIISKNGKDLWVNDYTHILRNEKGEITHYIGYINDISDRIKAEEKNKKLSTAVEQSANCIVIADTEGKIEYVNPMFSKLTGYEAKEVIGKNPRILNAGAYSKKYYKKLWDTISSGKIWKGEFCNKKKNGELYWEQATITPVKDDDGKIINYIALKEDITTQKKAEERITRFSRIFEDSLNEIYIFKSDSLKFTQVNSAAQRNLGYVMEELQEMTPLEIKPEFTAASFAKMVEPLRNNKKKKIVFETIHKRRDQSLYPVEVHLQLLRYEKVDLFTAIILDISIRKKVEEELRQRERYLSALNQASDLFLVSNSIHYQKFVELIGSTSGASRTYIFVNHFNEKEVLLTSQVAEFCSEGIEPEINNPELQNLPFHTWGKRWEKTLSEGGMINGKIADFPQSEKNILQPQGIQTILIIPLIVDKEFYGFIGFDNCVSEREWTSAEQEFLKAATNILQQNIKRYISLTLLQSENLRFRTTMDALDAMVYVSDLQTYELIFLNKYGRNIFGNKIGIKCYEALQKDMSKPCSFCTNHLLLDKKGNPKEPHVWEFQNSITKQWFQCRDQAIRWTDGRLVKLEIAIDITEKRKIEDALKESEEKFKNFFKNNLAVMMQIDSESKKIVGCNAAAVNYYGYSKKELLNKSIDELNDLPAKVINRRMEKAVQRKSNHFHFKHKLANNELRDVEVYSSPIKIKDKIRMFVIVHDITERKKIEAALESNEVKYRTLIEGSNDAIYLLYDRKFEIINKKFTELFGVTEEEIKNPEFDFMDFVSPKSKEFINKRNRALQNTESLDKKYEFIALNKDGKELQVEASVSYIKYKNGIAVQGILRDVTKRKYLEQKLVHSQKMESLGELAGGIAHDFNNILTSIFGFSELSLVNAKKDSPVTNNLEQILKAANRGKELIRHIMTFNRKTDDSETKINFSTLIKDGMKLIKPILPSTTRIRQDIQAEDKMIMANLVNVYSVLMNLCVNASHAMEGEKGILGVTLEEIFLEHPKDISTVLKQGEYLKLTVSDNGKGMSKELQEKIFEPFFTTKPRGIGTGMGLSTVHGIVRRHKGDITVYSEEGEGTSISIYFPVAGSELKKRKEKEEPLQKGTERILFVDDEFNITNIYEEMFTIMGYSITTRTSSTKALELFSKNPSKFDLIITDQTMPNLTGLKLAEEIKLIRKNIPIILCTGFSEAVNFDNTKNSNIDKIIQKPMQINEFLKTIRQVLDNKKYISN